METLIKNKEKQKTACQCANEQRETPVVLLHNAQNQHMHCIHTGVCAKSYTNKLIGRFLVNIINSLKRIHSKLCLTCETFFVHT